MMYLLLENKNMMILRKVCRSFNNLLWLINLRQMIFGISNIIRYIYLKKDEKKFKFYVNIVS